MFAVELKPIIKTAYYEISVDAVKNRVYLLLQGFWRNLPLVAGYVADLQTVLKRYTQPGYTLLVDARTLTTAPGEVAQLHVQAQDVLVNAGLRQTAEVVPTSTIATSQLNNVAKNTGMPRVTFHDLSQAEYYLDQLA